jgi:Phosphate-induced protein 1 conserved region
MIQRRKLRLLSLLSVVVAAGWLMNLSSAHASSTGNLIYHGGPVMAGNMKAYAIFWEPSGSVVSSTYNELIQRYFKDVGDSGLYANNQQYTQADGRAPTHAKLAGTFVDTSPYPSTPFLQDADIQQEITHAMSVQGWKPGINHAFFVYTALNEFICTPSLFFGGVCSAPFGNPCAYHFGFGTPDGVVLYGAMPYMANDLAHCYGLSTSPNHDIAADAEISATSHEQMELATDPLATGWFDATGLLNGEIGDKCAGVFGPLDATGANVSFNGHPYIVQEEWDNAVSGCAISGP